VLLQERVGVHDHAGRAVAALHRPFGQERLLHRVQLAARREPLDRDDLVTIGRGHARRSDQLRRVAKLDEVEQCLAQAVDDGVLRLEEDRQPEHFRVEAPRGLQVRREEGYGADEARPAGVAQASASTG